MAHKKTGKFDDTDDTGEFDDLDDVVEKGSIGQLGGIRKIFPRNLAEVLKAKFDEECTNPNECLVIPKDWLEEKLGMDTNKSIRGRSYQLKHKLNKQHGDLAGDGKIWHCGNIKNESYTIAIVEATIEVETALKHPAP
ncbi:unnamed protein product, partial [marine sediment metagenome]